jgi:hypothetical protein
MFVVIDILWHALTFARASYGYTEMSVKSPRA